MINSYTSIHNHSEFSNLKLIDSINKVEDVIQYAFDLGLNGVALTDHDCISGHIRAWNYYNKKFTKEQQEQFKLILGNEIYLCREGLNAENHIKGEKFFHLILLALDDKGHEQLRRISSKAWDRSYMKNIMRTPTYSSDLFDIIDNDKGHIIATTACLGGYCGVKYAEKDYDSIDRHLQAMSDLFGAENFFIELQPSWNFDQINYNKYMFDTYKNMYNFVISTDSHYLKLEDKEVHKVFLNSKSSGDREVDSFYASAYMMGYDEIKEYFCSANGSGLSEEEFNIMCENTNKISNRVQGYNLQHTSVIPKISYTVEELDNLYNVLMKNYPNETLWIKETIVNNESADIHLLNLVAKKWYKIPKDKELKYVIELDYECEQLYKIGKQLNQSMSDYFITMAKMIDIMWEEADSIVGPGRGSAGSSLVNYLLGITQIDPLNQPLEMPYWRFLHAERPGLADIDIDTEASKRVAVFNKVQEYFNNLGGDLVHVCTFGTVKSKSAIKTAAKGLDLDDDIATYLTTMIPNMRGNDWTLTQCYYGDEENNPIKAFKEEMDKYPKLWKVAKHIEGLVDHLGSHASGVLALNNAIWTSNSVMKTSKGMIVTAFDLGDTEQLGGVKYDFLTVEALDKIRTCMNWLLESGNIEWKGNLRDTYDSYLHPDVINYDNPHMWESLYRKEIPSCFQFDTPVGGQAIQQIHPTSLAQLVAGNGLMRLMANEDGILPLDLYCQHKNNISQWYEEMRENGLTSDEIRVLEKYLYPVYGVAVSQETMMQMSMDKNISNFTVGEANILRKAVAKKKADVLQKGKELFYNKGLESGTSMKMLDYVWNKQFMLQAGYSFSDIHAVAYSYIALQEMNLSFFYPSIYWKTACISVDAGALNEEDYYNLIEEGVVELVDDDDKREQSKVQYGKIASAIIKFRKYGNVALPNINTSRFGFTPNETNNTITYGLRGISRIGEQVIKDIIIRQPFNSLENFVDKMTTKDGKKLISKDKVINLIKAGAFNELENMPKEDILKKYVLSVSDQKNRLTLQNFQMLITQGLIPEQLSFSVKVYNFTKYIRKMRFMGNYILDENGYAFYTENYDASKVKSILKDGVYVNAISETYWDSIYDKEMDKPRAFIKANQDTLLKELNQRLFDVEYIKYAEGNNLQWELDSLSFYYSGHPLSKIELPIEITPVDNLVENEFDGFWMIKGKRVPKYKLRSIIGTVVDKDKTKGLVTIQTPDGSVINIKIFKQQFARFAHVISEQDEDGDKNILEDSFFEKGVHLLITGVLKGDVFTPKTYKDTGFESILRIMLKEDGSLDYLLRKSE